MKNKPIHIYGKLVITPHEAGKQGTIHFECEEKERLGTATPFRIVAVDDGKKTIFLPWLCKELKKMWLKEDQHGT